MTKNDVFASIENRFLHTPGYNCAQTVAMCMADYFGIKNNALKDLAAPFGGGLSGIRVSVCGALSGGLMVIGMMDIDNKDIAGKLLIDFVKQKYGNINCDLILDIDFTDKEQVSREKSVKKQSICTPLIKDVCTWLMERYNT